MELAYAALARMGELNPDGSVSLLGFDFDRLGAPQFPHRMGVTVVAKVQSVDGSGGEDFPGQAEATLDVFSPEGKSILDAPAVQNPTPVRIRAPKPTVMKRRDIKNAKIMLIVTGFSVPTEGEYEVKLKLTLTTQTGRHEFEKSLYFQIRAASV